MLEANGARKRTRTSTTVRPLAPEASASASSAIRAQGKQRRQVLFWGGNRGLLTKAASGSASISDYSTYTVPSANRLLVVGQWTEQRPKTFGPTPKLFFKPVFNSRFSLYPSR